MALPLVVRAKTEGICAPATLKIVDANAFVIEGLSASRSALLATAETDQRLLGLPWGAVVEKGRGAVIAARRIWGIDVPQAINVGDVVEVVPKRPTVRVLYRRGANGNVLFATERCNSFCLMCSQPPRETADEWRVAQNLELIELIDKTEPSLAITGGEPTLLGDGLLRIIEKCRDELPQTYLQVLSNGRRFASTTLAGQAEAIGHPRLQWNIPLYGDVASVHDYVVQARGAFDETFEGLYRLAEAEQQIEIRVVLVKPTVPRLRALANFIYRNMPFVRHVALMGIEPVGFAKANYDSLWMDPVDFQGELTDVVEFLAIRRVPVSIYNLPLCVLPRELWPYAVRSISDWKNIYMPECEGCRVRSDCGGFFQSVGGRWTSRGIRPQMGE